MRRTKKKCDKCKKLKMKLVFEQNKNINIEIVRKKQLQEYEKLIR